MKPKTRKDKIPEAFSRYLLEGVRRIRDQAIQGQGPDKEIAPDRPE